MIVKDFKENDLWVREKRDAEGVKNRTRAYSVWVSMMHRCKEGGLQQMRRPTYAGCSVSENFKDFQCFANWCNAQPGYHKTDSNGRSWQLDKDLLVKGNKTYSEDTCVFIPHCVNSALTTGNKNNRLYKLGVTYCKFYKRFKSSHKVYGKETFIGYYKSEEDAFCAYKIAREAYLKDLAKTLKSELCQNAFTALSDYTVEETD
jgi:hypothetical protein